MSMKKHHHYHHHLGPSPSQTASSSSISRRSIFGRRSPDGKKKTRKNTKEDKDRKLRALEAIRLLSFDIAAECPKAKPSPITPRTVTTTVSDYDAIEDECNDKLLSRTFQKPTTTTTESRPKLQALLRPLPMTDRNSSGGTRRTHQRSDSNTSYLSSDSDTSSEIGEWPSSSTVDDDEDYPRCICISHNNTTSASSSSYSKIQKTHSNSSRQLSITAVEEWNRRCEEEGGVFRREKYASDMLNNLNLNPLDQQQHNPHPRHHGSSDLCIDRRKSCSSLSPIESDDDFGDFSFDETEDDDISLTYSHDEEQILWRS